MVLKEIRTPCVIGSGCMGRQIALATAVHGLPVTLADTRPEALADARTWSESYLAGRVAKGKMTMAEAGLALERIRFVGTLADAVIGSDLVVEAITEDQAAKEALFRDIDNLVDTDCLVATNSSFLPSSLFAHCLRHPARLANLHFFHPAMVMELVEIVQGEHTARETADRLSAFCRRIGKMPIVLRREIEGFVVNRILLAISDTALDLFEGGYATPEDIDLAVVKGLGHPMGPFALMDLTGLDLSLRIKSRQYERTGTKPVGYDALRTKCEAGDLGRKSGRGWFEYCETAGSQGLVERR